MDSSGKSLHYVAELQYIIKRERITLPEQLLSF